jgi:hypothetical protein
MRGRGDASIMRTGEGNHTGQFQPLHKSVPYCRGMIFVEKPPIWNDARYFVLARSRLIARPFTRWRNKIESWRKELGKRGESIRLVYLCPLNSNCNHFTVLEINEQDEKIYHYDSNAPKGVIDDTRSTRVGKLVQVSQTSTSR